MGIVFIGMFMLAALVLMVRGLRLHSGKAVPVVLCLALMTIQALQLAYALGKVNFRFTFTEHLVLSLLFATVAFIDLTRQKRLLYR